MKDEEEKDMEEPILTNRQILTDVHKKVNEMYGEVFGNTNAGRLGYGKRIEKLEVEKKGQASLYIMISGISSGVALGIKAVVDFFHK